MHGVDIQPHTTQVFNTKLNFGVDIENVSQYCVSVNSRVEYLMIFLRTVQFKDCIGKFRYTTLMK